VLRLEGTQFENLARFDAAGAGRTRLVRHRRFWLAAWHSARAAPYPHGRSLRLSLEEKEVLPI
jgi:hypothetical protein